MSALRVPLARGGRVNASPIERGDFAKVQIRVGRVLEVSPSPKARQPAYVMRIDFGPLGVRLAQGPLDERCASERREV